MRYRTRDVLFIHLLARTDSSDCVVTDARTRTRGHAAVGRGYAAVNQIHIAIAFGCRVPRVVGSMSPRLPPLVITLHWLRGPPRPDRRGAKESHFLAVLSCDTDNYGLSITAVRADFPLTGCVFFLLRR